MKMRVRERKKGRKLCHTREEGGRQIKTSECDGVRD